MPALRLLAGVGVRRRRLAVVPGVRVRLWPIVARHRRATSLVSLGGTRLRGDRSSASSSRPTSRCARRRSSSTTSRATRAAFGARHRSRSASSRATRRSRAPTSTAQRRTRSTTCRCGTTSRCSTRSGRSRRSGPTTTSCRSTTTATRSTGSYRQIMLSARELNSASLPNRTWINEQLTFTHGYGLTLGPVNEVTPEGLPVLFIKDLPPEIDRRSEGHAAGDLLRRTVRRPRLRQDEDEGVRLPARRRQRLCRVPGQWRRAGRRLSGAGCCSRSASGSADTFFSPTT